MTFREYIERWKKGARRKTGKHWKNTQDDFFRLHINPVVGHVELCDVDQMMISEVLDSVREKGLSAQTEKHIYNTLNIAFRDAIVFFKLLKESPVVKEYHCPKVTFKEPPFLRPEAAWIVLDYVYGKESFGPAMWLQTLAALRVGEAIGLMWEDVDFENDCIFIRRQWDKNLKILKEYPKNGIQVRVPMIPALKKFLQKFPEKHGYVCKNQLGDHINYEGYKTYLRRLAKKLKLAVHASHGLRHSCTEIWVTGGATVEHIQRLLNHSSVNSTKRYIHRTDEVLQSMAKKISRPDKAA